VSPWWREEISAQLAPDAATLVHRSRGLRRRQLVRATVTVADSASWHGSADALGAYLEAQHSRNIGLCITLRGSLVRYLALPPIEILSERDAMVYAQQSFADLYGPAAENWAVCLSGAVRGLPRIAAAADMELIDALRAHARKHRLKLRSVRPALCAAVEGIARGDKNFSGWLVLIDTGHSCIARFSAGHCMAVRTARFAESTGEHLLTQLEQDALCSGSEAAPGAIYVDAAAPFDDAPLRAHGWNASPLPAGNLA
jgi:hypothetical protein